MRRNFTFYYTRFERRNHGGSPMKIARTLGVYPFVVNSIANLIIATHPNIGGFVLTTGSNWNRLINELRLTDGKRATAPCIDLLPGAES